MKDKKKKIFKIIQVVYDIISAVFIVFVCVAMAISPKQNNSHSEVKENDTTQVEKAVRKNYGYNDENGIQILMYNADFMSTDFFNTFLYGVGENTGSSIYLDNFSTYSIGWNTSASNFYYESYGIPNGLITSIDLVVFEKTATQIVSVSGNEVYTAQYRLKFSYQNSVKLQIRYNYMSPIYDLNDHDMGSSITYVVTETNNLGVPNYVYRENNLDGYICPIITNYHKVKIQDIVDRYNEGYQNGFNRGYSQGYSLGDTTGYDRGFVDGAEGIETNAFTTMTQAFEAIGGIFSINVLPNLPLWVLVFAPLIVAVVIVVVKLIKG